MRIVHELFSTSCIWGRESRILTSPVMLLDLIKAGGRETSHRRSTASRAMFNEHSEIELEVNDVGNVEAIVYHTDVTANDDVAVVSRAGWQAIE
jgi:hypothetical protein